MAMAADEPPPYHCNPVTPSLRHVEYNKSGFCKHRAVIAPFCAIRAFLGAAPMRDRQSVSVRAGWAPARPYCGAVSLMAWTLLWRLQP